MLYLPLRIMEYVLSEYEKSLSGYSVEHTIKFLSADGQPKYAAGVTTQKPYGYLNRLVNKWLKDRRFQQRFEERLFNAYLKRILRKRF